MRDSLVSVIIPAYNRGDPLRKTVQSVLDQTHSNLEAIVVDDCSTIPASTTLAQTMRKESRVKVIRHEINMDVSAARNTGLAHAQGELIAFLDHDDLWRPEKLVRQRNFMDRGDHVACVTDLSSSNHPEYNRINSKRDEAWLILTGSFLGMASSMLVRRTAFDAVGPFDRALPVAQDWDWLLRFHEKGFKLGIVPERLTHYDGSHRRPAQVEISDLIYVREKHIPLLSEPEAKILDAALKWKMARVVFTQHRLRATLELARVALNHPVHFSRYVWTVYEGVLREMSFGPHRPRQDGPSGNIASAEIR